MEITFKSETKDGCFIRHAYIGEEDYYFKVDEKYKDDITGLDDPFAMMLIFRMMREGGHVKIKGRVSKSLLASLELYAAYWAVLVPKLYKKIDIWVQEEFDDAPVRLENKSIACFSGGLDAAYLLYRHKNNLAGRNNKNIERCIFIWGSDIGLEDSRLFKQVFKASANMCSDLRAELVAVQINYRNYPNHWGKEHLCVMAACMRFWKSYPYQLMGSSFTVDGFVSVYPTGTNPVTDQFLNSNNYKLIVDDIEAGRTEKAALVKQWKTGIANLKVCSEMIDGVLNCGICEKCMRTYLNFRACGVYELACMNVKFDRRWLKYIDLPAKLDPYDEIIKYVKEHNVKDDILLEIENKILNYRRFKNLKSIFNIYSWRLRIAHKFSRKKKKHYEKKLNELKHGPDPKDKVDVMRQAVEHRKKHNKHYWDKIK